jgi:elongation factor G
MAKYKAEDLRSVAFVGHNSSGKTALVDKLLGKTGTITRPASVDDGTSICDFEEEAKHHKHSFEPTLVYFDHAGKHFQVFDTPGYPEFVGHTIGALRAVDLAAIVINAHSGIEVNTRRVFREAGEAGLARMIVISKMDSENIDFPALVDAIKEQFGSACVPFNIPIGHGHDFKGVVSTLDDQVDSAGALLDREQIHQQLIESIIEVDDEVTERYFEGQVPTPEEVSRLTIEAVSHGSLIPIVCLSSRTGAGLAELLDALALCSPPSTAITRTAKNSAGEEVAVKSDPAGPLVAQVFRTRIDPFVQKLSFIRVFSGTLKKDDTVHVAGIRKPVKLTQLLEVQANETHAIDAGIAGQIVAVAKTEDLHTGASLGDVELPPMHVPRPMVGLAVTPKTRGDEGKLSGALHKLVEEDPTFRLDRDAQTKELVMTGMSELHLQVIREKLKRRDKVEVETKEPKIPYHETIQAEAEGSYRHKKQSGGRGQFGEVHIRLYPLPSGTDINTFCSKSRFPSMREHHYDSANNFLWVDSIVGGSIPNNFLPAIEKGFRERLERGVIAGYGIQNVAVEVFFGKHHPVDSSEAAFKTAGSMAFRNVFQQAKPSLLEPHVKLHITVPGDKVGDINSDMSGRRGRVLGMDSAGGNLQTITVEAPLAEVTSYARTLTSMTGGQGSYTMEFSHYDLVPGNVQKTIVEKAVLKEEEEE